MADLKHAITLIPGDGIGPEVSAAVVRIVETAGAATGVAFEWHKFAAGAEAFERFGSTFRRRFTGRLKRIRWR